MSDSTNLPGIAPSGISQRFTSQGRIYEYVRTEADGRLVYRILPDKGTEADKSVVSEYYVDPSRDFNDIITEGITNGVFSGPQSIEENPNGITKRAEAIFEWWRAAGCPGKDDIDTETGSVDLDDVCGPEAYYRPAVRWFLTLPNTHGLYNYRDMEGAITWLEVAYILYAVMEKTSSIPWNSIAPSSVNVSYKINQSNGKKLLENRLSAYKDRRWMKSYLRDLQRGASYIPLPAYCSFVNMVNDGIHPNTEAKPRIVNGVLTISGAVDIKQEDWCLMEVSRSDFKTRVLPRS